jgi:hypothetical protein
MKFESFLLRGLLICLEQANIEMIIQPDVPNLLRNLAKRNPPNLLNVL